MKYMIIAVDFDGTLCENKWPEIGEPNTELIEYLKGQQQPGDVKLILWTCRNGERLEEAVRWCKVHGLIFDAVNANLPETLEWMGGDSRKIFAHEYIDDKLSARFSRPFVKTDTGITDETIRKLEVIFGFPFYDWQKRYLKGEDNAFSNAVRSNGKTFAYCIRLLLGKHEPFDLDNLHEIEKIIDETHGERYALFFRDNLRDMNDLLLLYGFHTNQRRKGDLLW